VLENYYWPGNIRQLKNITEQISIIETNKELDAETLKKYLPNDNWNELPVLYNKKEKESISERELLYKVLFDMQKDLMELKKIVYSNMKTPQADTAIAKSQAVQPVTGLRDNYNVNNFLPQEKDMVEPDVKIITNPEEGEYIAEPEIIEESLSLQDKEREMIRKALEKHNGKRKAAAKELGISERTLYRKIKEYNIR
jgi:transcriptional regulator with PAS, ATPase and Fis domain